MPINLLISESAPQHNKARALGILFISLNVIFMPHLKLHFLFIGLFTQAVLRLTVCCWDGFSAHAQCGCHLGVVGTQVEEVDAAGVGASFRAAVLCPCCSVAPRQDRLPPAGLFPSACCFPQL